MHMSNTCSISHTWGEYAEWWCIWLIDLQDQRKQAMYMHMFIHMTAQCYTFNLHMQHIQLHFYLVLHCSSGMTSPQLLVSDDPLSQCQLRKKYTSLDRHARILVQFPWKYSSFQTATHASCLSTCFRARLQAACSPCE